jgi:hypothetical protein
MIGHAFVLLGHRPARGHDIDEAAQQKQATVTDRAYCRVKIHARRRERIVCHRDRHMRNRKSAPHQYSLLKSFVRPGARERGEYVASLDVFQAASVVAAQQL